ncbi:MAG: cadmium-translocating P-type ATPase [Actinomycetota bacterium]|nr:cadmium-translocating P-type ATPase [Actinomycetota bacterium]
MTAPCCDSCCEAEGRVQGDRQLQRLRDVKEIRASALAGVLLAAGALAGGAGAVAVGRVAFAATLVVGGATFVPQSMRAAARGKVGVGTLMTLAAAGAVVLGELGEAATLSFLFSMSEGLEAYALTRSRQRLRALLELLPPSAAVLRDGQELSVHPDDLEVGDRMLVRPGERIPTDGVIVAGRGTLDLSALTGESVPVELGPGDRVFAAAINGGAFLEVEVTAGTRDNALARIVHIVEEAQERKAAGQRMAERIARPLVPAVMIVALGVGALGSLFGSPALWVERALVVLVAAAPCAFAISVPVTVVAAIGAATRSGVLVKGGAALEALAAVEVVALDKTGTLTSNQPRVIEVVAAPGVAEREVLEVAAALEARSEHPLAAAVLAEMQPRWSAEQVEAVAGSGLIGLLGGDEVRLGRPGFVHPGSLAGDAARLQDAGATVVLVERAGHLLGAIGVRDEPRPEARRAVSDLKALGISRVVMLTGDNARTAAALREAAGVDEARAELLPEQKAEAVRELRAAGPVAMVGDGINDAPALASADVGIAMGAMGSDLAIETADVALMGDDLRHLPDGVRHARRSRRLMRQNLVLSGGILVVLVPLAVLGVLGLAAVVAAHELAEVLVIANGVRAGRGVALNAYAARTRQRLPADTGSPRLSEVNA